MSVENVEVKQKLKFVEDKGWRGTVPFTVGKEYPVIDVTSDGDYLVEDDTGYIFPGGVPLDGILVTFKLVSS